MWIFDVETLSFLEVNQAAIVKYGYTREEFLQMTILDIRPAEDVPLLLRYVVHPTACGPSNLEQWRHQRKDGTIFDVEITSFDRMFHGRRAEIVVAKDISRHATGQVGSNAH